MAFKVRVANYDKHAIWNFCLNCDHERCLSNRLFVEEKCKGCNEELGTDNWLMKDSEGDGWHRECKIEADAKTQTTDRTNVYCSNPA